MAKQQVQADKAHWMQFPYTRQWSHWSGTEYVRIRHLSHSYESNQTIYTTNSIYFTLHDQLQRIIVQMNVPVTVMYTKVNVRILEKCTSELICFKSCVCIYTVSTKSNPSFFCYNCKNC